MEGTTKNRLIPFGVILGASVIVATVIGAAAVYRAKTTNVISVTGSATKQVTSDTVKWTGEFSRITKLSALKAGSAQMYADEAAVKTFLMDNGINESQIDFSPVSMMQNYDQNQASERDYTLSQTVTVSGLAADIPVITGIAKSTEKLIDRGVIFQTRSLQYFYSKLPEERVALLGAAVVDAKARAEQLAASSGGSVGALRSASSGVVQVLPENSIDVSDYGTYDTSTIEKQVMVTVKASFNIR